MKRPYVATGPGSPFLYGGPHRTVMAVVVVFVFPTPTAQFKQRPLNLWVQQLWPIKSVLDMLNSACSVWRRNTFKSHSLVKGQSLSGGEQQHTACSQSSVIRVLTQANSTHLYASQQNSCGTQA